jgi:hypothetical protein
MNRSPVKSTNIKSVGWEADSETLEVEFSSGGIYQYAGVTRGAYEAFINAPSLGLFFHEKIRGVYDFKRMNPLPEKKPKEKKNGQEKESGKKSKVQAQAQASTADRDDRPATPGKALGD